MISRRDWMMSSLAAATAAAAAAPSLRLRADDGDAPAAPRPNRIAVSTYSYEQMEMLAPEAALVQAKTCFGGGTWYTLDLEYDRISHILRQAGYSGYISLEFEGQESHAARHDSAANEHRSP